MKIHYLQHVPFENLGYLQTLFQEAGHQISYTRLYESTAFPPMESFDALVVLGGPMSVHDEDTLDWLATEKQFVKNCVTAGKKVLGVCLGGQMLSEILGGRVIPGTHKEIGWFHLQIHPEFQTLFPDISLAPEIPAFHWHGEQFTLPEGATPFAATRVCPIQGFVKDQVLAFQFHLETTAESALALCDHCPEDLAAGPYTQSRQRILSSGTYSEIHQILRALLCNFNWI